MESFEGCVWFMLSALHNTDVDVHGHPLSLFLCRTPYPRYSCLVAPALGGIKCSWNWEIGTWWFLQLDLFSAWKGDRSSIKVFNWNLNRFLSYMVYCVCTFMYLKAARQITYLLRGRRVLFLCRNIWVKTLMALNRL